MDNGKKPKVVFAFVEAGLGHIMPMNAISDAFEKKYGDKAEVVRTYFFQDTKNPKMKAIEDDLVKQVKLHNKNRMRGTMQFFLMAIGGSRLSMHYMMQTRYKKGFAPSMQYVKELDPDLIVNTHFATLYYSCQAKANGLIDSDVFAYCPDPVIGRQWDRRVDKIGLSSKVGKAKALKGRHFKESQLEVVPFLIRSQVKDYNQPKTYYREQLGLPKDNFTILLADGAYGAGKLKQTVYELLKTDKKLTIVAVCGKNQTLYEEFCKITAPDNVTFVPYGFTDKMLTLSAACDLFVGKAGASNLAEPSYFGAPSIVTFLATPIEKWICEHYVKYVGCAVKETNIKKAAALAIEMSQNPTLLKKYQDACISEHRFDGPEIYADLIWERLQSKKQ